MKRTNKGVWQGLHSLPEVEGVMDDEQIEAYLSSQTLMVRNWRRLETIVHDFSHYRLYIEPVAVHLRHQSDSNNECQWVDATKVSTVGMPAPIETLIKKFLNL